jgi:hypothetical protein
LKLPIAVWAGIGGDPLAVDAQREMQFVQETSGSIGART